MKTLSSFRRSVNVQPGAFKTSSNADVISSIKSKEEYQGFVSVEDEESGYGSFLADRESPKIIQK